MGWSKSSQIQSVRCDVMFFLQTPSIGMRCGHQLRASWLGGLLSGGNFHGIKLKPAVTRQALNARLTRLGTFARHTYNPAL